MQSAYETIRIPHSCRCSIFYRSGISCHHTRHHVIVIHVIFRIFQNREQDMDSVRYAIRVVVWVWVFEALLLGQGFWRGKRRETISSDGELHTRALLYQIGEDQLLTCYLLRNLFIYYYIYHQLVASYSPPSHAGFPTLYT